jgi:hypothetical protein
MRLLNLYNLTKLRPDVFLASEVAIKPGGTQLALDNTQSFVRAFRRH